MADIASYVVDASVAAKWLLQDEGHISRALAVLTDFQQGRTELYAPDFICLEVASSVSKATRHIDRPNRPTLQQGWNAIEAFLSWDIVLIPHRPLLPFAYLIANQYDCSVYDATYLALAQQLGCQFIYGEPRLRRTLRGRVPFALWLEDYHAPEG